MSKGFKVFGVCPNILRTNGVLPQGCRSAMSLLTALRVSILRVSGAGAILHVSGVGVIIFMWFFGVFCEHFSWELEGVRAFHQIQTFADLGYHTTPLDYRNSSLGIRIHLSRVLIRYPILNAI
ncbi:hypothetical protein CC80DRAFT_178925 [Byssothecium circinans]|uniref:Uncharacterized protein n=1 Tax=Byssothecium circinans TaxID=147558 RepID=A0A6A5TJL5_9PLEO|nr:hypothetical protein CC80DRAFT_178925 [Byssothecium circinans]